MARDSSVIRLSAPKKRLLERGTHPFFTRLQTEQRALDMNECVKEVGRQKITANCTHRLALFRRGCGDRALRGSFPRRPWLFTRSNLPRSGGGGGGGGGCIAHGEPSLLLHRDPAVAIAIHMRRVAVHGPQPACGCNPVPKHQSDTAQEAD
jgi:hypothetical protein